MLRQHRRIMVHGTPQCKSPTPTPHCIYLLEIISLINTFICQCTSNKQIFSIQNLYHNSDLLACFAVHILLYDLYLDQEKCMLEQGARTHKTQCHLIEQGTSALL